MPDVTITELPMSKEDGQRCHICIAMRERLELAVENAAIASTCIVVEQSSEPTELNFTCPSHRKQLVKTLADRFAPDDDD